MLAVFCFQQSRHLEEVESHLQQHVTGMLLLLIRKGCMTGSALEMLVLLASNRQVHLVDLVTSALT